MQFHPWVLCRLNSSNIVQSVLCKLFKGIPKNHEFGISYFFRNLDTFSNIFLIYGARLALEPIAWCALESVGIWLFSALICTQPHSKSYSANRTIDRTLAFIGHLKPLVGPIDSCIWLVHQMHWLAPLRTKKIGIFDQIFTQTQLSRPLILTDWAQIFRNCREGPSKYE